MKNKRFFILVFIFLIVGSFLVYAQSNSFLPEGIEKFAKFLFLDLGNLAKSSSDTFVIYAKFIFFLLVFTVLYWGASHVPGMNKKIGGTIVFIFALISTILIPKALILFIFNAYSTFIGFFFAFIPFIIGLILAHRVFPGDEKWQIVMRSVIYIAMGVFTFALVGTLNGFNDPLYQEVAKWAEIGAFIALIMGFVVLLGGIRSSGDGGEGKKWPFSFGGGKTPEEKKEDTEKKLLKGEEVKETKADTKMLKLASEMENVDGKLEDLNSAEINAVLKELKTYEKHRGFLDYLENILLNSWNASRALYQAVSYHKTHPQAFKEREGELEEHFKMFQAYIRRLGEVLTTYKNSLEKQESLTKKVESLEKKHRKLLRLLGNLEAVSLKGLKNIYNISASEDAIRTKLKKDRSDAEKRRFPAVKKKHDLMNREWTALRGLIKEDKELGKMTEEEAGLLVKLKIRDEEDIKISEKNLKKISRFSIIGSYNELHRGITSKLIWLGQNDVRLFYDDIKKLKGSTEEKIQYSQRLEVIESNRKKIEDYIEKVVDILKKLDKIVMATTLNQLKKL